MNSRIVQPAPSFQPPDTCTEHVECQAAQTPLEDLRRNALEHYEHVSTVAHQWHSAIPKAIAAYYADPERARLEREVIERAKAYGRAARAVEDHVKKANEDGRDPAAGWQLLRDMESTQEDLMLEAVWPLIEFESQHLLKK